MRTLIAPPVLIRPTGWTDAVFVARLIGDRGVRRFLGGVVPWQLRPKAVMRYIRPAPREAHWTARRVTGARVGIVSLNLHADGSAIEISYQFHPDAWGQGLALSATRWVLARTAPAMGDTPIIAETQEANLASRRLLDRLGMVEFQRHDRFGARQIAYVMPPDAIRALSETQEAAPEGTAPLFG